MPPGALRQVATVLQTVLQRHGLAAKVIESQLQQRWAQIAGDQIAQHSRPDQIRFRKLYLVVDNSLWLQQLMFLKPTLIEKINAMAGHQSVGDIVLRIGELRGTEGRAPQQGALASSRAAASSSASAERPPALPEETAKIAEAIKDPDLREKLVALMTMAPATAHAGTQIASKPSSKKPRTVRSGSLPVL